MFCASNRCDKRRSGLPRTRRSMLHRDERMKEQRDYSNEAAKLQDDVAGKPRSRSPRCDRCNGTTLRVTTAKETAWSAQAELDPNIIEQNRT